MTKPLTERQKNRIVESNQRELNVLLTEFAYLSFNKDKGDAKKLFEQKNNLWKEICFKKNRYHHVLNPLAFEKMATKKNITVVQAMLGLKKLSTWDKFVLWFKSKINNK